MSIFDFLDLLGTAAFAISGALFAINKRMDPFGVLIIAFVTAVGGGTLRDVLIGADRITWMNDLNYIYVITGSVIFAIVFRKKIGYLSKSLFLFDTIGLGIFTIIGTEIGVEHANFRKDSFPHADPLGWLGGNPDGSGWRSGRPHAPGFTPIHEPHIAQSADPPSRS